VSDEQAVLRYGEAEQPLEVFVGTEGERGLDIGRLLSSTGMVALDYGFANTAWCRSSISFVDGSVGALRYRGYPIEVLAEKCDFVEVAYLLMEGELPTTAQLDAAVASVRPLVRRPSEAVEGAAHVSDGLGGPSYVGNVA